MPFWEIRWTLSLNMCRKEVFRCASESGIVEYTRKTKSSKIKRSETNNPQSEESTLEKKRRKLDH